MHLVASTNILTVLGQLSSTLAMVYMATTSAIAQVGYPTLDLAVELIYTSSDVLTEAALLAFRPAAIKVISLTG